MPLALLTPSRHFSSIQDLVLHRTHALLGVYAVGHFIYRYYIFFHDNQNDNRMGLDDQNDIVPLLFIPHIVLQLSGFGFQIPRKRHPEGTRIWPEYRWHALIFFLRSLTLLCMAWWRFCHHQQQKSTEKFTEDFALQTWVNAIPVFATMISADRVTNYYRSVGESSPTIRGFQVPPGVGYLMSSAQFHATVHCLVTRDSPNVQLAAASIVQLTSFGMTLSRKRIIDIRQSIILYSFVLGMGILVIWEDLVQRDLFFKLTSLGNMAAILRMDLSINKYLLWTCMAAFLCTVQHRVSTSHDALFWVSLTRVTTCTLLGSSGLRWLMGA